MNITPLKSLILAAGLIPCVSPALTRAAEPAATVAKTVEPANELEQIAVEAYAYGYPSVLLAYTRKGIPTPDNTFNHVRNFPGPAYKRVVGPNADTLYSSAWLDLTGGPLLLKVPDTAGRYYVFQLLDAYTNTFAAPGTRTSGTSAHTFAIVGPKWTGELPADVKRIDSPTNQVWIIGRTRVNGEADLPVVRALQDQYRLTPLNLSSASAAPATVDLPTVGEENTPPKQVAALDGPTFFTVLSHLLLKNPAPQADAPALTRFARIGLELGRPFDPASLSPDVARAVAHAAERGQERIRARVAASGKRVKGWRTTAGTEVGDFGTDYDLRAAVALAGLGALRPIDAVYLGRKADDSDQPLIGDKDRVLHFAKGELPPARAFWSVSIYNTDGYFTANPLNRYAIGDRDPLHFNDDGSLDVYLRHTSPAAAHESNWLPVPQEAYSLSIRIYWPKAEALEGKWNPPSVNVESTDNARTN